MAATVDIKAPLRVENKRPPISNLGVVEKCKSITGAEVEID